MFQCQVGTLQVPVCVFQCQLGTLQVPVCVFQCQVGTLQVPVCVFQCQVGTIQVPVCVSVPSGYPVIKENPTLKAVEKDRNTVMVCMAEGNPDPSIIWLKDFIPVDLSDPRLLLLQTGAS